MSTGLYTITDATKKEINKFRITSGRSDKLQSVIYQIDPKTYEIKEDKESGIIDNIAELIEELPETSPKFIILSISFETNDGRKVNKLVLVYYRPQTTRQEVKMIYASSLEFMKTLVNANKFIEIDDSEELEDILELVK